MREEFVAAGASRFPGQDSDGFGISSASDGSQLLVQANGIHDWGVGEGVLADALVKSVVDYYLRSVESSSARVLGAIHAAHDWIRRELSPRTPEAHATVIAASIHSGQVSIAWVGHDQAFLLRNGAVRQRTSPHTLRQKYIDVDGAKPEEAKTWVAAQIVLRFIGHSAAIDVDCLADPWQLLETDVLVMLSGPATEVIAEDEIGDLVGESHPRFASEEIVRTALDRGVTSGVTAIVGRAVVL